MTHTKGNRRPVGGSERPRLDAESQAQIGRMLKAMYDEVAQEQIPDKLLDLLRKLEAKEASNQ